MESKERLMCSVDAVLPPLAGFAKCVRLARRRFSILFSSSVDLRPKCASAHLCGAGWDCGKADSS